MNVLVGTNDLKGGGTVYRVQKFFKHESYNKPQFANDIAVFRVKGSIVFNDKVQPIELLKEEAPDKAAVQLTGWGAVKVRFFC